MPRFFDKHGEPIDWYQHAMLTAQPDYKLVGYETLPDSKLISTMWLGVGMTLSAILMFETMVFTPSFEQIDSKRYSTLEEAELGHQEMVSKWKEKVG